MIIASLKSSIPQYTLRVHPYVASFIQKGGLLSLEWKWRRKNGFGLSVIPVQNLTYLQYQFYDAKGNEIDLKEEMEIK